MLCINGLLAGGSCFRPVLAEMSASLYFYFCFNFKGLLINFLIQFASFLESTSSGWHTFKTRHHEKISNQRLIRKVILNLLDVHFRPSLLFWDPLSDFRYSLGTCGMPKRTFRAKVIATLLSDFTLPPTRAR